ncbi:MAG TPA: DUF1338 domain-containing protein [Comamonadaceae bacterium]|nr:DUF1338 domain-containing protein [Comamonadaceae bacterium]
MKPNQLLHPDEVRALFSGALSDMYKTEVPLYGTLLDFVADINASVLSENQTLAQEIRTTEQLKRLGVERHGAIRLGSARELATIRRLFAVMGMHPVSYYDLSIAGVPVHATSFRPTDAASLAHNPFRVFTSLLRLELIADVGLRERAAKILEARDIFTERCLDLVALSERQGGLTAQEATEFVAQALETFRWHSEATVDIDTYQQLRNAHPLIADVVCFKGPHINHLTPRVLDIDEAQAEMLRRGIRAKDTIEGPPPRRCPILLRQTSFLALEEPIGFIGETTVAGTHTARFGEIEQRGQALTRKGRALYDQLLAEALEHEKNGMPRAAALHEAFRRFPDQPEELRKEGLAYFRYTVNPAKTGSAMPDARVDDLVASGWLVAEPLVYEDFLPVSAAGIFRSNLGHEARDRYELGANKEVFEQALGSAVEDEFALYAASEAASLADCREQMRRAIEAQG